MPSSSNSGWAETVLVAGAAAAMSTYLVLQFSKNANGDSNDKERPYPFQASFLQNKHTITGNEESTALNSRGWSMEEALSRAQEGSKKARDVNPLQVLTSLQKGNSRFWTGSATRPEVSAFERRALIKQQFPSTAILGCSDSRVPVEIVFDQGLGDMFVVRVAGNCLGETTSASLEYAVHHLNVKVLLVMGHEGCGAIKAAGLPVEKIQQESHNLSNVLQTLKKGLEDEHMTQILDARARDREMVALNVRHQVVELCEDEGILAKVNNGKLIIVGAFYEISSGIVDFFMQVSQYSGKGEFKPSPGVQSRYNPVTREVVSA